MIDFREDLLGRNFLVDRSGDPSLVVDSWSLTEELEKGLETIWQFIEISNMSDIPNAITGDAARRILFALITDFRLARNLEDLNDLDWMVKLDEVGLLADFDRMQKKKMGRSAINPKIGYERESTRDRPDGVVSTRFGVYKAQDGDDGVDVYSPSSIKQHGRGNNRGRIVDLIGCDESQTVGVELRINGKSLKVRVSKLGDLMRKDWMRIDVLEKSINKRKTPWGNELDDEQIAEAQKDLNRLRERRKADIKFLEEWKQDGRKKLPWGEEVDDLLVANYEHR